MTDNNNSSKENNDDRIQKLTQVVQEIAAGNFI